LRRPLDRIPARRNLAENPAHRVFDAVTTQTVVRAPPGNWMTDPQAPPFPTDIDAREIEADRENSTPAAVPKERAAFVSELFERHRDSLLRHLSGLLQRRADAEDVLQETYARLLGVRYLDETGSRARAYLFKIATNLAYDRYRARKAAGIEDAQAEVTSPDRSPEQIVDFAQGLEIVSKTLLELKPRCRQVFLLRAVEELEYHDIAAKLNVSKRTVEREMKHALDVCQHRLKRKP
jgi:RNA polymerase sigma-70 factor (ECF subfamily)